MKNWSNASEVPWINYSYKDGDATKYIKITSVEIGADVLSIGSSAFSNCTSLAKITFAKGSKLTGIGDFAFYNCSKLADVAIPATVTAIGTNAFSGSGIKSVAIPAGVETLPAGAFENCKSLATVTFAEGSKLTIMQDWVFKGCSALKSIALPASLTVIGNYAFADCSAVTAITIPAAVTSVGTHAFTNCAALESVTLPAGLPEIGDEFFMGCTNLKSITIPANVTAIGDRAFKDCSNLATITFAAGSKLKTIGAEAFYNCGKLGAIAIPAGVTSIGSAEIDVTEKNQKGEDVTVTKKYDYYHVFDLCLSLKSITVDANNKNYTGDASGVLYNKKKTVLIKFPAASAVKEYTIGKNVTEIKDYAFESSKNLQAIKVEAGNAKYTADDYGVLHSDNKTILVQYPAGRPDKNYVILGGVRLVASRAFSDCANLTEYIHIPPTVSADGRTADGLLVDSFVNLPDACRFCCDDSEKGRPIQSFTIANFNETKYSICIKNSHCEHDYKETGRIEPTCSKVGKKVYTCSKCQDIKETDIAKLSHTFGKAVVVEGTCRRPGSETRTCSVCNETEVKPITYQHKFVLDPKASVAVTCEKDGKNVSTCSVCGEKNEEKVVAKGHQFGAWTVDKVNEPGVAGSRRHTCSVCKEEFKEDLPELPIVTIDQGSTATAIYKTTKKGEEAEEGYDVNGNLILTCKAEYLGRYTIKWECSDPKLATIIYDPKDPNKITVKAIGNGTVTITARALGAGGADIKNGKDEVVDASASIEVKAKMNVWQIIVAFFRGIKEKLSLKNIIGL